MLLLSCNSRSRHKVLPRDFHFNLASILQIMKPGRVPKASVIGSSNDKAIAIPEIH